MRAEFLLIQVAADNIIHCTENSFTFLNRMCHTEIPELDEIKIHYRIVLICISPTSHKVASLI